MQAAAALPGRDSGFPLAGRETDFFGAFCQKRRQAHSRHFSLASRKTRQRRQSSFRGRLALFLFCKVIDRLFSTVYKYIYSIFKYYFELCLGPGQIHGQRRFL
jgi:hypothetical protein